MIDEDLLAQMEITEESPDDPRQRRTARQVFPKSEFDAEDLESKVGERVWVRCITDAQPWADDKPLKMWKEYLLTVKDAIMLDERRFAVILHSKESLTKPAEKPKAPAKSK